MICNICNRKVPLNARLCPSCQADVGFPNVRATQTPDEKRALTARLERAYISTDARGCKNVLERFGIFMLNSKSVFCRSLDNVLEVVSNDNALFINFHKQIASGIRIAKDDKWEIGRPAVESTLFPHYVQDINFACLTLNNKGLTNYGAYSIVFKEVMICNRTSVFEENPFHFMEKHLIIAGQQIPAGYRASWDERDKFAMAKLHSKIDKNTSDEDFPEILLKPGKNNSCDEFIEAHIYGPIHQSSFERIIGPRPVKKSDLTLWKSLETKCNKLGIILEVS